MANIFDLMSASLWQTEARVFPAADPTGPSAAALNEPWTRPAITAAAPWRPGGHWDVDDGFKDRQRYNRWGAPLTEDEAHGPYRGPPRVPLPGPRMLAPLIMLNPCMIDPVMFREMCADPGSI